LTGRVYFQSTRYMYLIKQKGFLLVDELMYLIDWKEALLVNR
jgi:hypothetical protein